MIDRSLERAHDRLPTPTHIGSDLRLVARGNLRRLLEHFLFQPMLENFDHRRGARIALFFGGVGVGVDPARRCVFGVRRGADARLVRLEHAIDLLRPVARPYDLFPLAAMRGWLVDGPQKHLFCEQREATALDRWVLRRAWSALSPDERFRDVVRTQWPRALGLDQELVDIALRSRAGAHRRSLLTSEFTIVWRNEEAFRRVARENPKLLPLLMALAEKCRDGLLPTGRDPVAHLKSVLAEDGITGAAWRYVSRHGSRLFRPAWRGEDLGYTSLATASGYLDMLQRAGLPPPPPASIAASLAAGQGAVDAAFVADEGPDGLLPDDFLELYLREADRRRKRPDLVLLRHEMAEAIRWPLGLMRPLDPNQMRAGWPALMRRMRRELVRYEAEESRLPPDWRKTFAALEFDGLLAVPIDNRAALRHEGERMRNCLAGYAERCRIGLVQIVSFREAATGRRVGDAAYERQPLSRGVTWRLVEVKEFANAHPGPRIQRLALACEDVLNVMDLAGPPASVRKRLRQIERPPR